MRAKIIHRNTHVYDLSATLSFYEQALGLTELRRSGPDDGSWLIVFIGNDESDFELELTWNQGFEGTYDNGGGDTHIAVRVDDFDAYHALHERMGCIVRENPAMGLYFIADPDGCWIEVLAGLDDTPREHNTRLTRKM